MKNNIMTLSILANTETKIDINGGIHAIISNKGSATVYVSKKANVIANEDGVKAIESNSVDIIRNVCTYKIEKNQGDWRGTIYVLADNDTKIQIETINTSNFKLEKKGSDENVSELQDILDSITISKMEIAEDGYSTSYELLKNSIPIGDKINIPKDLVVESGSVKECIENDTPVQGYVVGDKYIDLVIANSDNQHVYVLVSDLVDNEISMLSNFYQTRPTTANINPTGSGGLITFKATNAMSEGKPLNDGHIIHFYWDTKAGYDSQLFLKDGMNPCLQIRSQSAGTWSDWFTILDSNNYTNFTYTKEDIKTALNSLANRLAKLDGGTSSVI